jgi:iron-sulfur cluster assembly accessory protein
MVSVSLEPQEALLHALLREGHEVGHDCDGSLACASCVVVVQEGAERLSAPGEDELDILDKASFSEPGARLACQAVGDGEISVTIPRTDLPRMASAPGMRSVTLSERAARHFAVQLARRPGTAGVRLSVQPSGCSGFGYRVDFADAAREDDAVFQTGSIRLLVDPLSLPYVQGASIDVVQEGLARKLRFDNPNARHTCGCGESFGT